MLKAYLHNKAPRQLVRREDVVTSCVFGALEASGEEGLDVATRFLHLAHYNRISGATPETSVIRSITYDFWPWLTSSAASAEPDVLLTVDHGDTQSLVAIEAKLDFGKSSFASTDAHVGDQLAREWLALHATAKQRGIMRCMLIYLTADLTPSGDIADSLAELAAKHPDIAGEAQILWLSWRDLPNLITPDHSILLRDMKMFLLEEHLGYFIGFRLPARLPAPWRFVAESQQTASAEWRWPSAAQLPNPFRFAPPHASDFTWPTAGLPAQVWRFTP